MNAEGGLLFRREALEHSSDRLEGSVSLAPPLAWQMISGLLLLALAVAISFAFAASYSRVVRVKGTIALDSGVAAIQPSRPGVIVAVEAREGEAVKAGAPLFRIRAEEAMYGGSSAPSRIREALVQQDEKLATQSALNLRASAAAQRGERAQIEGLEAEVANLDKQIEDQRRLVDLAASEFDSIQGVARNGYISRRDVTVRETTLVSRKQELLQLQQSRGSAVTRLAQSRQSLAEANASAGAALAGGGSSRAALAQQLAQAELLQGYAATAPVSGTATAVTGRLGQPVAPGDTLMLVVPEHSRPVAELYVPSSAAGFLAPGQLVRLAIDAFPYQRFGTVEGQIISISSAAVTRKSPESGDSVFLVSVRLSHPWIDAFGRRQALLPGMTLAASIVTEKRSLIEWLFEPVLAVRNR